MKPCKFLIMATALALLTVSCGDKSTQPVSNISNNCINDAISQVESTNVELLENGVRQAAALWRSEDGSEEDFVAFVKENYASTDEDKVKLFEHLSRSFELIYGAANQLNVDLQKPTVLTGYDPIAVDDIFGAYSTYAHISDDMFANKIAFITILNFPHYSLTQKNELGQSWSRLDWAFARMGDMFTDRLPADVVTVRSAQTAEAEAYIASYNIKMDHLLTEDGRRIFPEGMSLLSHWNLRDELKSDYADVPDANEKQEMIYKVMERITTQEIPAIVINNPEYDWAPYSNKVYKDGNEISFESEGATRYSHILNAYHTYLMSDPYYPELPTEIDRHFEGSLEVPVAEIEDLYIKLISSEQMGKVAQIIKERLGRELRPYDIWYDGFKSRSSIPEDYLTSITRAKYPTPAAFRADMPRMLQALGFEKSYSEFIADKIEVEPALGSGHAWPSAGRGYKSFLRTRTGADGMDYKGYNIAVHEFGHNVEETIDLYDIDYYTLGGVPNDAFTEALAFVFQKRDLQLLGYDMQFDDNTTLDIFWGMYEIMGVSLVDIYTWRWLYENPDATAESLRDNCLRIAKEVWNKYFEPIMGTHDSPILAIYSHMVNSPMYLPSYPFGTIIEYQIEEYLSKLPNPSKLGDEITRIYKLGKLTPQIWMNQAVGSNVSIDPILNAIDVILAKQ